MSSFCMAVGLVGLVGFWSNHFVADPIAHAHFESVYLKSKIAGTSCVIPKNQGTTVSGFAPFTVISGHSVAISSLSARYHKAT